MKQPFQSATALVSEILAVIDRKIEEEKLNGEAKRVLEELWTEITSAKWVDTNP